MYNVQHQAVPSILLEFLDSVLLTLRARCLTVCSLELTQAMCRGVWLSAGLRMSFSSGYFLKISSTALQNTYIHAVYTYYIQYICSTFLHAVLHNHKYQHKTIDTKRGQIKSGLHSTNSVHILYIYYIYIIYINYLLRQTHTAESPVQPHPSVERRG